MRDQLEPLQRRERLREERIARLVRQSVRGVDRQHRIVELVVEQLREELARHDRPRFLQRDVRPFGHAQPVAAGLEGDVAAGATGRIVEIPFSTE